MKVLLIKTTSMGDVLHTLPALTDAGLAIPGIRFDWVVEEPFAEIPAWHSLVDRVIPIAIRRWRKNLLAPSTHTDWRELRTILAAQAYDYVLDAQGLVKSAFLTYFATGKRVGLDFQSARESLASFAYQKKCKVNFYQHAIVRMRSLFSLALDYPSPTSLPDFGIARAQFQQPNPEQYLVFLHSTTWTTKEWPETYWAQLADIAFSAGYRIKMSGGNPIELARAKRIAERCKGVDALPRLSIAQTASLLASAQGVVAVDTGFGHLAAALNVPLVSIYGATNPEYTGAIGLNSSHLTAAFPCAPCLNRECNYKKPTAVTPACYESITPTRVWAEWMKTI